MPIPSRLEKIGRAHLGHAMPRVRVPLRAFAFSAGWSLETDAKYDWDGLKRGERPFVLFQYTLAGEGRLRHGGREMAVRPGHAMLLHFPQANRYFLPRESKGWEFLYLCLQGGELVRLWQEFEMITGPLVTLPEASATLDRAIDIYEHMKDSDWHTAYEASLDAYGFGMTLASEICGDPPVKSRPPWLARVERHLAAHLDRETPVEAMARIAGYSRYHFTRLFEQHTGKSPAVYLTDLRMKKAASLLHQGNLPVREVAYRCGFTDSNYFGKTFRRVFGLSPGDYRKAGY